MADKSQVLSLRAKDVMVTEIMTVAESTPLSDVCAVFMEHGVGGLPVTNEVGLIVGVISIHDLVDRYAENPDSANYKRPGFYHMSTEEMLETEFEGVDFPEDADDTAGDIMTAQVYQVDGNVTLLELAQKMVAQKVHRLVVAGEDGKAVGLVSTWDVVKALADA